MNETDITKILETVVYPKLEKNLVELKLIDSIKEQDGKLEIILSIINGEIFENIKKQIKQTKLNTIYKELSIKMKIAQHKEPTSQPQEPNNKAPYAKKIIAVTSGKGGVGKTTISVNLSVALASKGYKVGLLDADAYGPNVPRMLGLDDEKLHWDEEKIIPSQNYGIKTISVALTTPQKDTPLIWRSSVAISALVQFLEDVRWGELDYLVIDMPPGTGDTQLTMTQELPISSAIIVTTPQAVALDDASRAIMMLKEVGVKISGIVENMSYFIAPDTQKRYNIFGTSKTQEVAKHYGIPFLGKIPLEIQLQENSDNGRPAVVDNPKLKDLLLSFDI